MIQQAMTHSHPTFNTCRKHDRSQTITAEDTTPHLLILHGVTLQPCHLHDMHAAEHSICCQWCCPRWLLLLLPWLCCLLFQLLLFLFQLLLYFLQLLLGCFGGILCLLHFL